MRMLLRWLISALTLIGIGYLIEGINIESFYIAIITALILGLVNAVIRPILVILTLPINIISLGLFVFVINAILFWFVASFIQGFEVAGFIPAFFGALIMSVVGMLSNALIKK